LGGGGEREGGLEGVREGLRAWAAGRFRLFERPLRVGWFKG